MTRILLLTLLTAFCHFSSLVAQEGKLYTIWDGDTIDVNKSGISVDIVLTSDTIPFHKGDNLIYPDIKSNTEVISFLVSVNGKTTEFYNKSKWPVPPEVAALSGPLYTIIFADRRNMYVDYFSKYDVYEGFDEMGLEYDAEVAEAQKNSPHVQLYYQIKEIYQLK